MPRPWRPMRRCARSSGATAAKATGEMLQRLAKESGIETPTADDLVRLDRKRKGKRLSNADWLAPTDPEAKIAKLKDGRTRLAYKPLCGRPRKAKPILASPQRRAAQAKRTEGLRPAIEGRCSVVRRPKPRPDPCRPSSAQLLETASSTVGHRRLALLKGPVRCALMSGLSRPTPLAIMGVRSRARHQSEQRARGTGLVTVLPELP